MTTAHQETVPPAAAAALGSSSPSETSLWDKSEMAAGIALGLVSMAIVGYLARDMWFFADVWDHLTTREVGSVDDLLRPHAGHWATPAIVMTRLAYGVAEMDFWPVYFVPRLLGHAALSFLVWRLLLKRGADPWLSFVIYAVLLFSGVSAWHAIATIGNFIVFPALLLIAWKISSVPSPTWIDQLVVGVLLVAAVGGSGQGLAVLLGTIVATVVTRRFRLWFAPLTAAVAIYALWYVLYGRGGAISADLSLRAITRAPAVAIDLLGAALANTLALSDSMGPALVLALIAAIVALAASKRLGLFEAVIGAALVFYLGMVVLGRVLPGSAQVDATRYGYAVTVMLVPALIPHIRVPDNVQMRLTVGGIGAVLLIGNLGQLSAGLNFWEARSQASRQVVESTAVLMGRGEPYVAGGGVDFRAGPLSMQGLQRLVDDGWIPDREVAGSLEVATRGAMRMANASSAGPASPTGALFVQEPAIGGCVEIAPGDELLIAVQAAATLTLSSPRQDTAALVWEDEFGEGERAVEVNRGRPTALSLASPISEATLTVAAGSAAPLTLCGLTESP